MDRPSLSEQINITGWPVRRASTDSVVSVPGINLNSDSEDAGPPPTSLGRKGPTEARNLGLEDGDVDMKGDPSMRGMEMLAEFAQRVAEEERKGRTSEERDPSPGKGGVGPKYTCAYCAKTFSRPSSLRIHTYSREQHFSLFTFSRWRDQILASDHSCAKSRHAVAVSRCNPTSNGTPRYINWAHPVWAELQCKVSVQHEATCIPHPQVTGIIHINGIRGIMGVQCGSMRIGIRKKMSWTRMSWMTRTKKSEWLGLSMDNRVMNFQLGRVDAKLLLLAFEPFRSGLQNKPEECA